jgi:hypothetical protein
MDFISEQLASFIGYREREQSYRQVVITSISRGWIMFENVPNELRTSDLCLASVTKDGNNLEHVPEGLRTPELCREAVRQNAEAIRFVPQELLHQLRDTNQPQ